MSVPLDGASAYAVLTAIVLLVLVCMLIYAYHLVYVNPQLKKRKTKHMCYLKTKYIKPTADDLVDEALGVSSPDSSKQKERG